MFTRNFIWLAAIATLATACNKNEDVEKITFFTEVDSRAANDNSDNYFVYAHVNSVYLLDQWYIQEEVHGSDNEFISQAEYKWQDEFTSFFAYAPYSDAVVIDDNNFRPIATFTVPEDAGTEFTVASPIYDRLSTEGSVVRLSFNRMLTKVTFEILLDSECTLEEGSQVSLTVYKNKGTASLANLVPYITPSDESGEFTYTYTKSADDNNTATFYIMPQSISATYITLSNVKVVNNDKEVVFERDQAISSVSDIPNLNITEFASGTSININLQFMQ